MASRNINDYQKRIQTQNLVILALSILIVVLVIVSSTAAWYIRTRSDTADIILSDPVNIYITEFRDVLDDGGNILYQEHTQTDDILKNYQTRIYPGDKIKLKLGAKIADVSSPAYVRIKLQVVYEDIVTGEKKTLQDMADLGQIEYVDAPDESLWEKVDFNAYVDYEGDPNDKPVDCWYVLKDNTSEGLASKIVNAGEEYVFLDGYIKLNELKITNAQANCKIHICYAVQAIQTKNVPDPLQSAGIGPWWQHEDIYWDWED